MKEGAPVQIFSGSESAIPTSEILPEGLYKYIHIVRSHTIAFSPIIPGEERLEHKDVARVLENNFLLGTDDAGSLSITWGWSAQTIDEQARETVPKLAKIGKNVDLDTYRQQLEKHFGKTKILFYTDATATTLGLKEPNSAARELTKRLVQELFPDAIIVEKKFFG